MAAVREQPLPGATSGPEQLAPEQHTPPFPNPESVEPQRHFLELQDHWSEKARQAGVTRHDIQRCSRARRLAAL